MRTITSYNMTMLTIKFLKEYGVFDIYFGYFKKRHPEYSVIRNGFYIFLNNELKVGRWHYFDASVSYTLIFYGFATALARKMGCNKAKTFFYDMCELYLMYMDENGCNNATIIECEEYKDIRPVFAF